MFKGFLNTVSKRHVERKILHTNPNHLFRIIVDVDQYASFLPLCSHSQVLKRWDDHRFDATLTVGLPPLFHETYVSAVTAKPQDLVVETTSIESRLFDSLSSRWKLQPVTNNTSLEDENGKCLVDFEVNIAASDPLVVSTLDQVLREVAGRQVAAFEARCRQLPLPPDLIEETEQDVVS